MLIKGKLKWRGCRIVGSENVSEQDNAMVHIDKSSSVISNEEFEYYVCQHRHFILDLTVKGSNSKFVSLYILEPSCIGER